MTAPVKFDGWDVCVTTAWCVAALVLTANHFGPWVIGSVAFMAGCNFGILVHHAWLVLKRAEDIAERKSSDTTARTA